jgi:hypothetical protein
MDCLVAKQSVVVMRVSPTNTNPTVSARMQEMFA